MSSPEQLSFAFRNWVTLSIVFTIGYTAHKSIFSPYDSTMAMTMSLVISHFTGSALHHNLQRLLGFVLGKTLPILILMVIAMCPCGVTRTIVQILAILALQFVANYVYYSSATYSYIGLLVAAFGTYP